jgi:hypothetical protein
VGDVDGEELLFALEEASGKLWDPTDGSIY